MIYLDNASTTKPCEEAKDAAIEAFNAFGNPSSLHKLGVDAEKIIKSARDTVSKKLLVDAKNIYFTSGGTESNNIAIIGSAMANKKRGNHLITTQIEHPSVLEPFRYLEKQGFEVTYLKPNSDGEISLSDFENAVREDTILASVMAVNNEIGTIEPFDKLKEILNRKAKNALLHTDAVQGFCKIPLFPKKCGIDLLSVSAHKIHGIKGTGALYIADGVHILPVILGGGQEKAMRSGTENVVGISAFGAAVANFNSADVNKKRNELKDKILKNIPNTIINGPDNNSGYILNVSFLGIKAEILLHSLEAKGIFVSTGSACSSNKPQPSHVLIAMGKSKEEIMSAIRFSFCEEDFDVDFVVETLKEEVENIRKYVR